MVKGELLREIARAIKQKRELQTLNEAYIFAKLMRVLEQDKRMRQKLEEAKSFKELSRSSMYKELVKQVRKDLREVYGVFDLDEKRERLSLLEKLDVKPKDGKVVQRLLEIHQSSKERLKYYKEIYQKIFKITGKPSTILDLACGANPYSYDLLGCTPEYIAVDLPSEDLRDLQRFFTIKNIKGLTVGLDLVKQVEELKDLSAGYAIDVAFLFKALDSFESVKKQSSEKILDAITSEWVVVSFPTKSLGGKKHIAKERRAWFEKMMKRKELEHQTFEIENEIFYVIKN